jgi:hypothetical protein
MYYCLHCGKPHPELQTKNELVFKTGFHFVDSKRYAVGYCESNTLVQETEKNEGFHEGRPSPQIAFI